QHAQAHKVVDGAREGGVPTGEPPLERVRFPIPRAERDDVPDVHVDIADAGVPTAEEQRRQERRTERLAGSEPVRHLRLPVPAFFWCRTLNDHGAPLALGPTTSTTPPKSPFSGSPRCPHRFL